MDMQENEASGRIQIQESCARLIRSIQRAHPFLCVSLRSTYKGSQIIEIQGILLDRLFLNLDFVSEHGSPRGTANYIISYSDEI